MMMCPPPPGSSFLFPSSLFFLLICILLGGGCVGREGRGAGRAGLTGNCRFGSVRLSVFWGSDWVDFVVYLYVCCVLRRGGGALSCLLQYEGVCTG